MRILVVEDEKKVASFIAKGLTEESYAVDVAYDGEEGVFMALENDYDLIVLDLMLPKLDGMEILRKIRDSGKDVPVLILTAKDSVEDIVAGLEGGSDDYLTKPFAFAELLARIRALLRRSQEQKITTLKAGDLTLNPLTREVKRGDRKIELTSKEYALLEYFMRNVNKVLTRTLISEHVWNYEFDPLTNVVDVYVNYLRKKIDQPSETKLIHTVRGVGYILKEP
ncbi:MAG: response regulator transcription factor [Deltaproteobacteria bacterium]|nr:response regulator transcription factor [Deltaproteobacteria bacterium]